MFTGEGPYFTVPGSSYFTMKFTVKAAVLYSTVILRPLFYGWYRFVGNRSLSETAFKLQLLCEQHED
jgi:hypothetical protein